MHSKYVTISLKKETKEKLRQVMSVGSFDDAIIKLLETYSKLKEEGDKNDSI
jgi:hypothetical protein